MRPIQEVMKRQFYIILFCLFTSIFALPGGYAQIYSYLPSQDVFVDEEQPGLNFDGQLLSLGIQNFGPMSLRKNILVKFDIPPGLTGTNSAYISFNLNPTGSGCFFDTVQIWEIATPWTEDTLTWNGMTGLGKVQIGTQTGISGVLAFQLPGSLVDNWSVNPASNHGIMLQVSSSASIQMATFTDVENLQNACTVLQLFATTVIPPPTSLILGPDTICSTEGGFYEAYPHSPSYNYNWIMPNGWTSGLSMLFMHSVASATSSGQLCLSISNSAGSSPVVCKDIVVVVQNSFPGALTGPNVVCPGDTAVFTLNPTWPNLTYIWEYPSDWILLSDADSTEITLIVGLVSGYIRVKQPDNECMVNPSASMYPYIKPSPELPTLTGPLTVLPNSLVTFSAFGYYCTTYYWTLPPGASILTGDSTGNVQIQFGNQGGNLCVHGVNECTSGPDKCLAIGIVGQEEPDLHRDITVFQDPASARQVIVRNTGIQAAAVQLLTSTGLLIMKSTSIPAGNEIRFNLPSSGLFLLKIRTAEGVSCRKVVIGN